MMHLATTAIIAELDSNPISDLLGKQTLDVSVLKKDTPEANEKAFVSEAEEIDAQRADELAQIESFIAKHGVTKPTEEDFIPKKRSWGGKKKAEKLAENPNYIERRGRPRTTFTKVLSFVRIEGTDEYKRAGRGRAKKGEQREAFTIHFNNIEKAASGAYSRDELVAMAKC